MCSRVNQTTLKLVLLRELSFQCENKWSELVVEDDGTYVILTLNAALLRL